MHRGTLLHGSLHKRQLYPDWYLTLTRAIMVFCLQVVMLLLNAVGLGHTRQMNDDGPLQS